MFIFSPMLLVVWLFQYFLVKKYLKEFKQNTPAESVIVLGNPDWFKLEGWIKPIFLLGDLKALVRVLNTEKKDFAFYRNTKFEDIEKVMRNKDIKEVYFLGHGSSHTFELNTDETLFYCDFNNMCYKKEFVHQVHCGTREGKSLIDYVVPEKNKAKCFLFRKSITSSDIKKEFKRREHTILSGSA